MAIRTFDANETFRQVAAFGVFSDNMRDDRPVKSVLLLEKIVIALLELDEIASKVMNEIPRGI